jgi:hypothetical protein
VVEFEVLPTFGNVKLKRFDVRERSHILFNVGREELSLDILLIMIASVCGSVIVNFMITLGLLILLLT